MAWHGMTNLSGAKRSVDVTSVRSTLESRCPWKIEKRTAVVCTSFKDSQRAFVVEGYIYGSTYNFEKGKRIHTCVTLRKSVPLGHLYQ